MKKVCFFGIYDPGYSRNRVLRHAFEKNGFVVVECRVDPKRESGVKKYYALVKEFRKINEEKFEHVIVCFPGHSVVWLARILFGKRIIFDAFLSLYDSNVLDRKLYSSSSPRAYYDWMLDWSACKLSRKILLDTFEHITFFEKNFFVPREKMIRFLISADEEVFFPIDSPITSPFTIHFHGMFIPLQGIKYILDAANLLKDKELIFTFVGVGQEYKSMVAYAEKLGLKNVQFVGKVPMESIPDYISKASVCLGIFGETDKTKRVIPNKVYECAAMGKPIITADTPAIREIFTDNENVLLCSLRDSRSLASAIEKVMEMPDKGRRIGENARKLFASSLEAKVIGEELIKNLNGKE